MFVIMFFATLLATIGFVVLLILGTGKISEENPWIVDVQQFPKSFFRRAIRMDFTTAIRATDERTQNYTVVLRHWFIDAWFHCERCKNEFCWTAAEQQRWFEEYKLRVDAVPSVCVKCRSELRALLEARQRYDAEIAQTLNRDVSRDQKLHY